MKNNKALLVALAIASCCLIGRYLESELQEPVLTEATAMIKTETEIDLITVPSISPKPPLPPVSDNIPFEWLHAFTITPERKLWTDAPLSCKRLLRKIRIGTLPHTSWLSLHQKATGTRKVLQLTKHIKHLPDYNRIIILSRGFVPIGKIRDGTPRAGGGVRWVHRLVENNIMPHAAWVTFDYLDSAEHANFGQTFDCACLKKIIDAVLEKNPHVKITLAGDCRGAYTILRYLSQNSNDCIDTIILECPYSSIEELLPKIAESYLVPFVGKSGVGMFDSFFRWLYPKYDKGQDNLMSFIENIANKRILIGHHLHDEIISFGNVDRLVKALHKNNEVYFFTSSNKEGNHSRMSSIPAYQNAVNLFCKEVKSPIATKLAWADSSTLLYVKEKREEHV